MANINGSPVAVSNPPGAASPRKRFSLKFYGRKLYTLLFDHGNWKLMLALLLIFEFFFGLLIIFKVNYTEIDWFAYMQEVEGVLVHKQYDYQHLRGDTGPLVYPAGFVYIYSILYYLTDRGDHILLAQFIFLGLYLLNLVIVGNVYGLLKTPPVLMVFLVLSKRIHSIFMLRLFNDPIAMIFAYASLYFLLKHRFNIAVLMFSLALSVKMNVLLFLPGILLTIYLFQGAFSTLGYFIFIIAFQVAIGLPFLTTNGRSYLKGAFDLGRQFDYKWTVNWRMVPQVYFNSSEFAKALLVIHVGLLLFFLITCWSHSSGGLKNLILDGLKDSRSEVQPTSQQIAKFLMISNLIGITVSRSLHYQFYSWYFHTLPFLLLCTAPSYPPPLRAVLLVGIEYSWNVYPSTPFSSSVLLACHLAILAGIWAAEFSAIRKARSSIKKD